MWRRRRSKTAKNELTDHPLVVFKQSPIHGTGGFARVGIRRGKQIIEYVGTKLSKAAAQAELEKQNTYIFTLDDDYDIDGSVAWNAARFFNHSCTPNCETEIVGTRIWVYALRRIMLGEELTYNYNHGLDDYQDRPCHCGAPNCVGYMVAEAYFAMLPDDQCPSSSMT
ncbi:MAG: SET domain-containing protein-lysine N-methyltransferase [bacterium]|nr:SET domain-containing protein-lysine N-methyltransferase [Deltaproteobacteria bacterium]MCZ6875914.1 SET domain-containing protein-lysine N-methyltransferase [bacterium]